MCAISKIKKTLATILLLFLASKAFSQGTAISPGGWQSGYFTSSWKDYYMDMNASLCETGDNTITFSYRSGKNKFCIKDVTIYLDGKAILTDSSEKTIDSSSKKITYTFPYTFEPRFRTLRLTAKIRTVGGSDISGLIDLGPAPKVTVIKVDSAAEAKKRAASKDSIKNGILTIAPGTTKIETSAYENNASITEIRIPNTVTEIGGAAFKNAKGLKKVVIPGSVKIVNMYAFANCLNLEEVIFEDGIQDIRTTAFSDCPKLISVTIPESASKIGEIGLYWQNKETRVFHCYAGSEAYRLAQKNGYKKIDVIGSGKKNAADLAEIDFSGNEKIDPLPAGYKNLKRVNLGTNVKKISAEAFRKYDLERIDLGPSISEIGKNAFSEKTILRTRRGSYAEKWAKSNGYYLCGVLADLNFYSRNKSKQINEDFTRILCDDDLYSNWSTYKFKVSEPLLIENVYGEIVLTSFMLTPCQNVTVTKNGKTLLSKKTIQPLTRTLLEKASGTNAPEGYKITSTDPLYKKLSSLSSVIDWTVTFNGDELRRSDPVYTAQYKDGHKEGYYNMPTYPVHCRSWIQIISNAAYTIASKEYENLCYKNVSEKALYKDSAKTKFLTKKEMDELLKKERKHAFKLGRIDGAGHTAGLGDTEGNTILWGKDWLYLFRIWFSNESLEFQNFKESGQTFFHEFSHNMGWRHTDGNMCPSASNTTGFPGIGSSVFSAFLESTSLPYPNGYLLNPATFSQNELKAQTPEKDFVKNGVLYFADGDPFIEIKEDFPHFTKTVIPSSASVIKRNTFYQTELEEVYIPGTIKIIEEDAFWSSGKLTKVTIEEGVKEIGASAFLGTGIKKLKVPESVVKFGENITDKKVVWSVKKGSTAHEYAVKNKYTVEFF
ncbi:MAG: leucine-rich repeat domain-containing protein [Treponema sp.]|nr:leucine-rich repeat domain-containing protein [Treponema sp.]